MDELDITAPVAVLADHYGIKKPDDIAEETRATKSNLAKVLQV